MKLLIDGTGSGVTSADGSFFFQPILGRARESGKYIFALPSVNNAKYNGALTVLIRSTGSDLKAKVDFCGYFGSGLHKLLFKGLKFNPLQRFQQC
jgi:hypothetical protein